MWMYYILKTFLFINKELFIILKMEGKNKTEEEAKIVINIKMDTTNEIMGVRVKPSTKFDKILEAFCEKNNLKVA
jgi:hypothetical protein